MGNPLELVTAAKIVNVPDRSFGVRWIFWSRSVGMKSIPKKSFKYSEENKLKNRVICRHWCDSVYTTSNDIKEILSFEEATSKAGKLLWWWCVLLHSRRSFNWPDWSAFKEMELTIKVSSCKPPRINPATRRFSSLQQKHEICGYYTPMLPRCVSVAGREGHSSDVLSAAKLGAQTTKSTYFLHIWIWNPKRGSFGDNWYIKFYYKSIFYNSFGINKIIEI